MRHDSSVALFQYWNRLRDGRPAPRRTEIEPADIKTLLADTFIMEKDVRGEAVFRLAGTRVCAIYGRELKGFSFPSLWRSRDQKLVSRIAQDVFSLRSVAVVSYRGISVGGRSNQFELLLLPLDGGVENPRSLGCLTAESKPYWLGIDPVAEALIESIRVIDPDREPLFLKNRPAVAVPPIEPSQASLSSAKAPTTSGRRIRHLVVLDGGLET